MRKLKYNILFLKYKNTRMHTFMHLNIFYDIKKKLRKYLELNLLQMRAILRISSNIV